jgi:predicted lipid-binding transport protein (Tim44 family)
MVAAALCGALVLAGSSVALARAGGGQHFGGGSHSSSGGSHMHSSSSSHFGSYGYSRGGGGGAGLLVLAFVIPGSILLIGLIVFVALRRQGPPAAPGSSGVPSVESVVAAFAAAPSQVVDETKVAAGIAAIQQRDPNFSTQAFLDRAQAAFFKLQQAWMARDQDIARDVMSDALYERHKMQTDQLIADHQIDMLENIVIGHAKITSVTPATPYDSIVVAFTASMSDYTIDENTKKIVDGDRAPSTFTEFWTFIRRADAKSSVGATTLASTCPSCGAPLKLTNGKCDFCSAPVRTSSSEWVVDQIEQAV